MNDFENTAGIERAFALPSGTLAAIEVLLAAYDGDGFSNAAFVLYIQDGVLYEVHGAHCSCYGLEGQWEPEETSWAAVKQWRFDQYPWEQGNEIRDKIQQLAVEAAQ